MQHLTKALADLKQLQEDIHCQSVGHALCAMGEFITHGTLDNVIANLETVEQVLGTKNDRGGNHDHSQH
ncbi:hypothetical protein D3C77_477570 [compost metagenome]